MITETKDNTFTDYYGEDDDKVIFGNPDIKTEFQAHVKLTFWREEESLSFSVQGLAGDPNLSNDKLSLSNHEWFKEGNDLKWVINLLSKPPTNSYSFKIDGWENYHFAYQRPFPNPKKFDNNGEVWLDQDGYYRPERVDGSYAVYHKTKRDHEVGKTNYGIGKVCHIYRPKATDALGKSAWVDIHIEHGVYTGTIPEGLTYPITINDTFGYSSMGGSGLSLNNNDIMCGGLYSPAANGNASSISVGVNYNTGDRDFTYGIWNDNSGEPGTLVECTVGGAVTTAAGNWDTQNLNSSAAISSGSSYWIGWGNGNAAGHKWAYDSDSFTEDQWKDDITYSSGNLPDCTSPALNNENLRISIYVTYTPSAGGIAPQAMHHFKMLED